MFRRPVPYCKKKVRMIKKHNEKAGRSEINLSAIKSFGALISNSNLSIAVNDYPTPTHKEFNSKIENESHPEKWVIDLFQNES
jgi:hypothetical protein